MNKKWNVNVLVLSLFLLVCVMGMPGKLHAENNTVVPDAKVSLEAQITTDVSSSGETVDPTSSRETKKAPGRLGLFFLGVKERVSLLTTFDPVKKAEKALRFAEERAKIAERLAEHTDDPKVAERLEKVLRRAETLSTKAEDQKEKLLENPDARKREALKNIINFQERKEKLFSNVEEKITPEQLQKIQDFKNTVQEKKQSLMNALENSNIPQEIKDHLEQIKVRMEEHRKEMEAFQTEQKELLDRVKAGDESAKEELKNLREERIDQIKENNEIRQENRAEIKQKLELRASSTPAAERKLERMEKREEAIKEKIETREKIKPARPMRPQDKSQQ